MATRLEVSNYLELQVGVGNYGEFTTAARMIDRSGNRGESSRTERRENGGAKFDAIFCLGLLGKEYNYFLTRYKPKENWIHVAEYPVNYSERRVTKCNDEEGYGIIRWTSLGRYFRDGSKFCLFRFLKFVVRWLKYGNTCLNLFWSNINIEMTRVKC